MQSFLSLSLSHALLAPMSTQEPSNCETDLSRSLQENGIEYESDFELSETNSLPDPSTQNVSDLIEPNDSAAYQLRKAEERVRQMEMSIEAEKIADLEAQNGKPDLMKFQDRFTPYIYKQKVHRLKKAQNEKESRQRKVDLRMTRLRSVKEKSIKLRKNRRIRAAEHYEDVLWLKEAKMKIIKQRAYECPKSPTETLLETKRAIRAQVSQKRVLFDQDTQKKAVEETLFFRQQYNLGVQDELKSILTRADERKSREHKFAEAKAARLRMCHNAREVTSQLFLDRKALDEEKANKKKVKSKKLVLEQQKKKSWLKW